MSQNSETNAAGAVIQDAILQKKKGVSIVWIVPFVAILIAAGLVYKAVTEKGPTITITFESAEGLEAGKTKIKYKDVEIGQVEAIELGDDLSHVIVTAKLIKESEEYLNEQTRFWVVRARFSGGVASGLGTLLSGSYIVIDPGRGDVSKHDFKGLEIPPIVTSDIPGKHYRLKAPYLGSLQYGSPIYFKGIRVGQVLGYEFSGQNNDLEIKIFIEDPYDNNVFETTRFWFASGFDMTLDSEGVRIDTQSVVSLLIGGIAFLTPEQNRPESSAAEETAFNLYSSQEEALAKEYTQKITGLLKFDNSVRGLAIDAPVEFRGFPIGNVVDMWLESDPENGRFRISVKIEVEPERARQLRKGDKETKLDLGVMIDHGLRAQLKTGNLLTGSLYVAIDFFEDVEPAELIVHNDIIEIPTIPGTMDELTDHLRDLIDNISKIPVEEISAETIKVLRSFDQTGKSFKEAGDSINAFVSSKELKEAATSINQSLKSIENLTLDLEREIPEAVQSVSNKSVTVLDGIGKLTAEDSDMVFELKRALRDLAKAAESIRMLADQLERHPESIITGKGKE